VYIFLRNSNRVTDKTVAPTPSLETTTTQPVVISNSTDNEMDSYKTYITKFGRWRVPLPDNWKFFITTPTSGNGEFGKIIESWIIQSFQTTSAGQGGIPADSVKMDFSIEQTDREVELEQIVQCGPKSLSCSIVTINGTMYKKDSQVLNSGMQVISLGTKKDNLVFRATIMIQAGAKQADNRELVDKILNNIKIE
jgi:hypothetical protein